MRWKGGEGTGWDGEEGMVVLSAANAVVQVTGM